MSKVNPDRCPYCDAKGVDQFRLQVLTCPSCGCRWWITPPPKQETESNDHD